MNHTPSRTPAAAARVHPAKRLLAQALHGALAASVLALGMAAPGAQAQAPAYSWKNVKIGGSGYVPGIIAHPGQQGLFYARTDVGGAYRYNAATRAWIALNDWTPASQFNIGGIDAIAVDPNNTGKLYMVAGMYYNGGNGVFLMSNDQGNTFTQVPLSFSTGANQSGRQVGERLMVDPNQGAILFYGTGNYAGNAASNGLWKSSNGGATWSKVGGFPALSNDGTGAGVSFIALHKQSGAPGQATPTLFAGINTKTAQATGALLYKSTDGGNNWSPVWGGPTGLLPQRGQIGPDGNLYITYSVHGSDTQNGVTTEFYGPDGLSGGQVWKYNIASNQWAYITPYNNTNGASNYGFNGLSVHPTIPGLLVINTINRYDAQGETMLRSADGGATWTDLVANATFDSSAAPWNTVWGPVHNLGNWSASVLDPFDANHAFVTSGGGIMESKNINSASPAWAYGQDGIEETVINVLLSPPPNQYNAYPLLSGGWDVCGYTHTSLAVAPAMPFTNPTCSKVTGMDYAKNNSAFVVRVQEDGWSSSSTKYYGAISWNGGYSWSPFNSNGTAGSSGGGSVAVNADGSTILWAPENAAPAYSSNAAYSWNALGSVLPQNVKIAADGYNPDLFYAYDRSTGQFYASANKAAAWAATNAGLTAWGDQLVTPPGIGGDVWLVTYNGLYHSTSSGWGNWSKAPGVTQATALGFGKAAPGAGYPAMYVVGTVNNVRGYYRSTDGGNSWLRINSGQQQWSGSNNVISGDPKTFGTVYVGTNGRGIMWGTSPN
jgi:hypothetical protein